MVINMDWAVFSDLHIEGSNFSVNYDRANAVIFAGDIYALGAANMDRFTVVDWVAEKVPDRPVIFVGGNHDFELSVIDEQVDAWKNIAAKRYPGHVHVLHNDAIDLGGVRVIGTPLFTNFSSLGSAKACRDWAREGVSDFRRIKKSKNELVTPEDYAKMFMDATAFLTDELFKNPNQEKLVVTHFAPSVRLRSNRVQSSFADAYWVNDLEHLVRQANVWVSGHTHMSADIVLGDRPGFGRSVCNARGYSKVFNTSSDPNFKNPKIITLGPAVAPVQIAQATPKI